MCCPNEKAPFKKSRTALLRTDARIILYIVSFLNQNGALPVAKKALKWPPQATPESWCLSLQPLQPFTVGPERPNPAEASPTSAN